MGILFIAVNGDNVGESIGNAIISDNHDELSRVSGSIKSAHQMLDQWVQSKGGKVIVSSGDEGIYSLPQQAVNELDAIKQKYASMANTSLTIGVGASMSQASKALIYGKMNNKDQVVHYEPAVDDYISNDGEAQAKEQAIEDELPTEQEVIDQGDASEEGQEGVDDEIDDGQIDGDGEEDNSDIEGEENDPNAEFSQDDEDGLDPEGELADQDEDGLIDDEEEEFAAQGQQPAPQKDTSKNPAAPQVPGKKSAPAPFGKKPVAEEEDTEQLDVPADEVDGDYGSEEMEDAQPEHEQDMGEEEEFIHDAQENRDDELDDDNIEADEEGEFAEDGEENMDAEFDPAAQDDGELSEDDSDETDQDGMNPAADGADEDMSEDEEEGFGGVGDEDDIQELGDEEIEQSANPEESDGIMSEMLHANMGDEDAEDSDDDIKQDIIESLMQFKTQRAAIEEMKSSNPELYQANIIMLRSMIQMAKKLKMNPERGLAEKGMAQDTQDAFPPAQEEQQADPAEQNPLLGKSESLQKTSQEGKFAQRQRTAAKRGTEKGVHNRHPQVTYHHDNGKFNEKKTKGTSRVGHMNQEMREGDRHPGEIAEAHNSKLKEMKQMKAPNLPKSEQNMAKKQGPCWDGYEKVKGKKDFSEDSCKKITKARVDEGKSPSMKQVARAGRNSRVKFAAGSPAGQHPDTGEHIRARKPGEGDKIVGTPKPRKPDMKAQTKMNKSKVEEIHIDLKKKPDVKKP